MKLVHIDKNYLSEKIDSFIGLIVNWRYCAWKEEDFFHDLPRKWEFSFAAYEGKNLIGFCFASNKIADVFYIHLIYITEKGRGKSYGKEMISRAVQIAKNYGLRKIELRCPESNIDAFLFYRKLGFVVIEKLKDETSGNEADYYLSINI